MTKILIKRGQAEASLPTLDPGEPAVTFESGGKLWIGTPSGNLEITGGGGSGTPGGSDTQVQFNDGGSFGGSSSFVFNKTTGDVTINGDVTGSSFITSGGSSSQFVKGDGSLDSTAYISGPAGSDTQIQFNDGGDFGGDSGFVFNDSTKVITLTSSQQSDSFIDVVHNGTTSISNERSLDFYANNSGASSVLYTSLSFGSPGVSPGSEFGSMVFSVRDSGSMVNVLKIDPFELVFNEDGADRNTRWEGDTATHLFVTDAGLDAVQIGTTAAGDIADFRNSGIVFNDSESDRDFRIAGNSVEFGYFYDAGNNRHGFGTGSPTSTVHIVGDTTIEAASQNYLMSGRADRLVFVGQTIGNNAGMEFFTNDGDGTDNIAITIYGVGVYTDITNRERMFFNYSPSTAFQIYSEASGTGTLRPIRIGMSTIATQLELQTNGNINLGGTGGALILNRLTTTQQNAITGVNGMIIYNTSTNKFRGYAGGAWVDLH